MSYDSPLTDYGKRLRERLGGRAQKLSIDAHLGCPNRDGTLSYGGCTFCLGDAFSPAYCRAARSITEQIDFGIAFHARRRRTASNYIAYFQAGTNTYAPIEQLERLYNEALSHPAISGIIIGTRPDCISSEKLDLLEYLAHKKYVAVEYGIESVYDSTLRRINRHHDFATAREAVSQTKERNIDCGAHFILGLPGESRDDIVEATVQINALGIDTIKFHQLQIYRSTPLVELWHDHPEEFLFGSNFGVDSDVELLIDILRRLDANIAVERIASSSPRHLTEYSPLGGIRPDILRQRLVERMNSLNAGQGDMLIR